MGSAANSPPFGSDALSGTGSLRSGRQPARHERTQASAEQGPTMMSRKAGWRSLWRFVLLAASILSSCFLLTEGQGTPTPVKIVLQPPHPAEGQEVTLTLTPGDVVEKAHVCRWYQGLTTDEIKRIFTYYLPPDPVQQNGPAFTGRETARPGCSLQIRNLTSEDTGNYTVSLDGRRINTAIVSASVVVSGGP